MKVSVLLLSLVALLCSCSSVHTRSNPKVDLSGLKSFYVVHRLTDDHHIDDTIVDYLKARGYEASKGPLTMMPQSVEAVITYRDEWAWDFKSYLIQLDVDIHRAHNNQPLGQGSYRQPSIVTKTPAAVVEEILKSLLPAR
jgi:hypothetical protein